MKISHQNLQALPDRRFAIGPFQSSIVVPHQTGLHVAQVQLEELDQVNEGALGSVSFRSEVRSSAAFHSSHFLNSHIC
jgi:hypothetical protein